MQKITNGKIAITLTPKNCGRFNFGPLIFGQKFSDQNLRISNNLGQKFRTNANGTKKFLKISETQHYSSSFHLIHLHLH